MVKAFGCDDMRLQSPAAHRSEGRLAIYTCEAPATWRPEMQPCTIMFMFKLLATGPRWTEWRASCGC